MYSDDRADKNQHLRPDFVWTPLGVWSQAVEQRHGEDQLSGQ